MKMIHTIFGAGPVGRGLAKKLVKDGKRVRLVTRSGSEVAGAETVRADASRLDEAVQAAAGSQVVYNCTNATYYRWAELLPSLFSGILEAAIRSEARLVTVDNLYMYGLVDRPMTEDLPNGAIGPKGRLRGELSDQIMRAHADGRVRATIIRASDFYGPGVENALLGGRAFRPLSAGKPVLAVANPDIPHSFTYVPDLVAAVALLGENPESDGKIWHAPTAAPISTREMLVLAGGKPRLIVLKPWSLRLIGLFDKNVRELLETYYMWDRPYRLDSSKFEREFGLLPTPLPVGLKETVASYKPGYQGQ